MRPKCDQTSNLVCLHNRRYETNEEPLLDSGC